ncbi:hypothetical protein Ga0102493_112121 [Erythrobacter litoralis]|jgi:hypothetical protein|uniref:Uncharacterized protein n=1 Tax=Erythrobacter litoralis TaxID=39960 RepID=A0A074MIV3_9SPHN|nr:hypothetical protein [Erythrobacter litoralis]AOL23138.1 hypothetical protein Ga0102493_112121 [Erythrobacter litoralis]KEO92715.1 hypothetical protein EH32_15780 [Erythrobacter litoralis]MEE4339543.1 hypothetical protein [Erythrobacter sp.]
MKNTNLFSLIAVAGGLALTAACAEPADEATETEADTMSVEETTEDAMAEGEMMAEDAMAEGEEMMAEGEEAVEGEMTEEAAEAE